jgi:hypothetical protein
VHRLGGDRLGSFQQRPDGLHLSDRFMKGGVQPVATVAFAFKIRPMTSRTLLLSGELGL